MAIDTVRKMMGGPGTTGVGSAMDKLYGRPPKSGGVTRKGKKSRANRKPKAIKKGLGSKGIEFRKGLGSKGMEFYMGGSVKK